MQLGALAHAPHFCDVCTRVRFLSPSWSPQPVCTPLFAVCGHCCNRPPVPWWPQPPALPACPALPHCLHTCLPTCLCACPCSRPRLCHSEWDCPVYGAVCAVHAAPNWQWDLDEVAAIDYEGNIRGPNSWRSVLRPSRAACLLVCAPLCVQRSTSTLSSCCTRAPRKSLSGGWWLALLGWCFGVSPCKHPAQPHSSSYLSHFSCVHAGASARRAGWPLPQRAAAASSPSPLCCSCGGGRLQRRSECTPLPCNSLVTCQLSA